MTNEELKKLSDETFFDNDTGEIQPAGHRNFNNHLIDHTDTLCEATLRNSKEYTDARETAILAAADSKDADTLRTAKEYADKIVAALAGSAPETLDTLQELAAALGDDPNFSATVMQMIGERVTATALAEALEGKQNTTVRLPDGVDLNEIQTTGTYDTITAVNAPVADPIYISVIRHTGAGNWVSQTVITLGNSANSPSRIFHRCGVQAHDWTPWVEVFHTGNFDPNTKANAAVCFNDTDLRDCNDMTENGRHYYCTLDNVAAKTANRPSDISFGLITMGSANKTQIAADYGNRWYVRAKHWNGGWSNWVKLLLSEDVKRTYHAQINPNGQVVSQSADWIQSVSWVNNGNGYRCDIVPKVSVNAATVQVTAVVSSGNYWPNYLMPIAYDTLVNGAITVCIVGKDGASSQNWFNISVQGA